MSVSRRKKFIYPIPSKWAFFIETFKYKSERLSNFTGVCTIGITIMFDGLSLILALKSLSKRYVAD